MNGSFLDAEVDYGNLAEGCGKADGEGRGIDFVKTRERGFLWERITIGSHSFKQGCEHPLGRYDTLTVRRTDLLSTDEIFDVAEEIARELCFLFERRGVIPRRILTVGLGNEDLTPDSLGAKCTARINATLQLTKEERNDASEIAVFTPGVSSKSGLESVEAVSAICAKIKPDAVIAIDALTARSPSRLGTAIQFSDAGIHPGSGVGKSGLALDSSTLGIPVFSVGVPTVISASAFCKGECGELSSMLVAPKEIDVITERAAEAISLGINQAFGII